VNAVSRLGELMAELCPDGVEYRTLDDVCDVEDNKRKPIKASDRTQGKTPYYGANNIQDFVEGFTHDGEYILIAEDGSSSLEKYSIQYVAGRFWANNHVHVVKGKDGVHTKFLYHYFSAFNFVPYLVGGTRAKLNKSEMLKLPIPLLPLSVQSEIVRVLDNFKELTAELTAELAAELAARKKQYEYYRKQLATMDGSIGESATDERTQRRMLGEICEITRGRVMSKEYLRDNAGEYPVYSSQTANSGIFGYINNYDYSCEAITWTTDGANAGSVFYHCDEKFSITNVCGLLRMKGDDVLVRYLYYVLQITAKQYVNSGMGNPKLMSNVMAKISIPIPSLDEQARIVAILDKFDALTTDITSGLPAEIAARNKQYEYYRDKLLAFKEAGV